MLETLVLVSKHKSFFCEKYSFLSVGCTIFFMTFKDEIIPDRGPGQKAQLAIGLKEIMIFFLLYNSITFFRDIFRDRNWDFCQILF